MSIYDQYSKKQVGTPQRKSSSSLYNSYSQAQNPTPTTPSPSIISSIINKGKDALLHPIQSGQFLLNELTPLGAIAKTSTYAGQAVGALGTKIVNDISGGRVADWYKKQYGVTLDEGISKALEKDATVPILGTKVKSSTNDTPENMAGRALSTVSWGFKNPYALGGAFGAGAAMEEDKSVGEVALTAAATALGAKVLEVGIAKASPYIVAGIRKFGSPIVERLLGVLPKTDHPEIKKLLVTSESAPSNLPITSKAGGVKYKATPEDYLPTKYEPYRAPSELPTIDMGPKPKSEFPSIQTSKLEPPNVFGGKVALDIPKTSKALPEALEQRKLFLEIRKDVLDNSPFNHPDNRFLVNREGTVHELGDLSNKTLVRKMEDAMARAGIQDGADFTAGLEKFMKDKADFANEAKVLREEIKNFNAGKKTAPPKSVYEFGGKKIENVKVSDLNERSKASVVTDEFLNKIKKEGIQTPILINKKNPSEVLDGIRRSTAAEMLGIKEIPAIKVNPNMSFETLQKMAKDMNTSFRPKPEQPLRYEPIKTEPVSRAKVESTPPRFEPKTETAGKETFTPKLAERTESKVVEKGIAPKIEGAPEARTMNLAEQESAARDFVKNDYGKAKSVAMGNENPPGNLRSAPVYKAVEERALKEGDFATLKQLTNSTTPQKLTSFGQEIKAADMMNDSIAVVDRMNMVKEARAKRVPSKAKAGEVSSIKKKLKEKLPNKNDWEAFINGIEC